MMTVPHARTQHFAWHPLRTDAPLVQAAWLADVPRIESLIPSTAGLPDAEYRKELSVALYALAAAIQIRPKASYQADVRRGMELLLKAGADVNARFFGLTPLLLVSSNPFYNLDVIHVLLKHGAEVDARDAEGNTPLMWQALFNQPHAVQLLLKYGADPNLFNNFGETPIDLALTEATDENYNENIDTIAALLEGGVDSLAAMGLRRPRRG